MRRRKIMEVPGKKTPSSKPYKTKRGRPCWQQTLQWLASPLCPKEFSFDILHMTCDTWNGTCDTWHGKCDTLHMVRGGKPSLKTSAPWLLRARTEGVLKIFPQRITKLINKWMNHKGVCRTAQAILSLLKKIFFSSPTLTSVTGLVPSNLVCPPCLLINPPLLPTPTKSILQVDWHIKCQVNLIRSNYSDLI